MRLLGLHILLAGALAAPAAALTPLPPCAGDLINGSYETWSSRAVEGGFVTYHGRRGDSNEMIVVLEHCKTGKAVVADAIWTETGKQKGDLDHVLEVMDGYLDSDRKYTLRAITRGMKRAGIKARQARVTAESCSCRVYFPDDRGS